MSTMDWAIFIAVLALYLFFQIGFQSFLLVEVLLLVGCMIQAVYALLQYTMILPTHGKFAVLGSYGNPAGLATNLAVLFPLIFRFSKQYKWLAIAYIAVILLAMVLSGSRTGLIAIMFAIAVYSYGNLPAGFRPYRKKILFVFLFMETALGVLLYLIKEDSAVGRTLVWQVTGRLFRDNLLFGGGPYVFSRDYMLYQADYFMRNPENRYLLLADNMMYAFNEYLLFFAKYGLVAFALLAHGFATLVKSQSFSSPYMLCLASVGLTSMFSYPFQHPVTWLASVYCLVQIGRKNKPIFSFSTKPNYVRIAALLPLFIGCVLLTKDVVFEYKWNKTAKSSLSGKTTAMLPQYEELLSSWNGNGLFLYNYAAELNQANAWRKSLDVLHKTVPYWNDYDIQLLYADNYMQLKEWKMAETHLNLASYMCPNRFLPLFKLHEVYLNTDRKEKAMEMANMIMEKEIKVPSSIIYSIQGQMRRYMESLKNN